MTQKWHQKASVQAAFTVGLFGLLAAVATSITSCLVEYKKFSMISSEYSQPIATAPSEEIKRTEEKKTKRLRNEGLVLQKKKEVLAARASWINFIVAKEEDDRILVLAKTVPLGKSLARIDDSNLRIGYQITKYEYALYSFLMAADAEKKTDLATGYADKAIAYGHKALTLIEEALGRESLDEYHKETASWIMQHKLDERINFLMALTYAVKYNKGHTASAELAQHRLNLVTDEFKIKEIKYEDQEILKEVLHRDSMD